MLYQRFKAKLNYYPLCQNSESSFVCHNNNLWPQMVCNLQKWMVLKLLINTGYSFVFCMFSYHLGLNQPLWTVNNTPIIWKKYGIFLPKLLLTTVRKNCSSDREFFFEIGGWRPRIFKNFGTTRSIYSSSERSEQFLVADSFFNLFLEASQI